MHFLSNPKVLKDDGAGGCHRAYTHTAGLSISHHQEELPGTGSGLALHFGAHLILFCFFTLLKQTNQNRIRLGTDHQLSGLSGNSCGSPRTSHTF